MSMASTHRARRPAARSALRSPAALARDLPRADRSRSIPHRRPLDRPARACATSASAISPPAIRRRGARLAKAQFDGAGNMTDVLAALAVLADIDCPERGEALTRFYERWKDDPLVIDKWFALQARSSLPGTVEAVRDADPAPGLHPQQPEPGARPGRRFLARQPAAFPRAERRRLRLPRRRGAGARSRRTRRRRRGWCSRSGNGGATIRPARR